MEMAVLNFQMKEVNIMEILLKMKFMEKVYSSGKMVIYMKEI